jgi:MarR family transcriptional regulator, organic hydroperoxide resistance regulator
MTSFPTFSLHHPRFSCILQLMKNNATECSTEYSLDDSLTHLCARFYRAMWKHINRELSGEGLKVTVEQWPILIHLWDRDGQSQKDFARKLFKDKTTIARLVAGMEAAGMVERAPGEKDRREKSVSLTEKGREIMDKATAMIQRIDGLAEAGTDKKELAVCKDVLRRVHRNLER